MLQQEFVKETFMLFRQAGIHTALETNLSLPWKKYEMVLPFVDLIMADIKIMENDLHIKWTGSTNKRVIQNILALDKTDKQYILRTPVVPDVNASREQMQLIISFVSGLKILSGLNYCPFIHWLPQNIKIWYYQSF